MNIAIGNDLIDLSLPEIRNKAQNRRFVKRVLSSSEQESLQQTQNRDLFLWSCWAAKEAAYKCVKKLNREIKFSPCQYVVNTSLLLNHPLSGKIRGEILFRGEKLLVQWEINIPAQWIHCIVKTDTSFNNINYRVSHVHDFQGELIGGEELSDLEMASVYSPESKKVRQLAKNLDPICGKKEYTLVRPLAPGRLAPPQILLNGKATAIDVSLSHDGNYVAAVLAY